MIHRKKQPRVFQLLAFFCVASLLGYFFLPKTTMISQLTDSWYDEQGLKGFKPHPSPNIVPTSLKQSLDEYSPETVIDLTTQTEKVKAAFVILTKNEKLQEIRKSMRQVEDRFNRKFGYPYIFLNQDDFTDEFKEKVTDLTKAKVTFGKIEPEMWGYPKFINQTYAAECRKLMEEQKIIFGGDENYRHMCRFQSGFFFRHPLLDDLEYYWRVEPEADFYCDIDYDVFQMMKDNDYKYGWTMSLTEYPETIGSLWDVTTEFMKKYPQYVNMDETDTLTTWLTDDNFTTYNGCHFWSNFEIGSLAFFRSERYIKFFEYLDHAGGFFYERWGDAPVHSIAVALMLKESEVHFFNDIGYRHPPLMHCPVEDYLQKKCHCDKEETFDFHSWSCSTRYRDSHPQHVWDEETYNRKTAPYRIEDTD